MKQKYTIMISDDNSKLVIHEFAELDKDVMSLLCEESYDFKTIKSAIKNGKETKKDVYLYQTIDFMFEFGEFYPILKSVFKRK